MPKLNSVASEASGRTSWVFVWRNTTFRKCHFSDSWTSSAIWVFLEKKPAMIEVGVYQLFEKQCIGDCAALLYFNNFEKQCTGDCKACVSPILQTLTDSHYQCHGQSLPLFTRLWPLMHSCFGFLHNTWLGLSSCCPSCGQYLHLFIHFDINAHLNVAVLC